MTHAAAREGRPRILVADDNAEMRSFVRRLLADRFDVQLAENGRVALQAARANPPALVITDVVMPDMSGLELLREIRADPRLRTVPVIVFSERGEEDALVAGLEAGADDFVAKPFSLRELTARVNTSIELARMREAIEHSAGREEALREEGRRKDAFLAMLAHELRNPLAPIGYAVHMLGMSDADAGMLRRAREMLARQVEHLTRIVDDLLDVSRLTTGKLSLKRERVDIARVVRDAAEDRRGTLESHGIHLDVDAPGTPVWVSADATRLAQVVDNTIDNAQKFTAAGGRVTVSIAVGRESGEAILSIRDTGAGIEPALLPHVFEPFTQAEQSLDRRRGGLGLGLAVVKGIVELHGGSVSASSEGPDRGTSLTIRLPVQRELPSLASAGVESGSATKRLQILVVEDNLDSADMLRALLEFKGYAVSVAHTGDEGVRVAVRQHPDVVLCDIGLPGMDGYAVAEELRRNPETARARLIAVTGYGQEEDRRRALDAGFDLHLVKPVDPHRLLTHLQEVA